MCCQIQSLFEYFYELHSHCFIIFIRRHPLLVLLFCTLGHITGFSRFLTPAQGVCVCVALVSVPAVMLYCPGHCSCHWTGAEPVLPSANNLFLQEERGEKSSPAEIQHRHSVSGVGRAFHSKERRLILKHKNT